MNVYTFLRKPLKHVFIWMFRVEVEGKEKMPDGPLLVCPNHIALWDPIILGAVFDRQIHFMAKASLFKVPLLSSLIKALGAFPVHRGAADPSSIKTAISYLKNGEAVGIFPQGTRVSGSVPENKDIKQGASMIAYRSKADVLPVFIKTKNYKTRIFKKVRIIVGDPIPNGELGIENGTQAEYAKASELIFDKVLELMPEE